MGAWRIIWTDSAGQGRYTDCASMTRDQAVWEVGSMESEHAQLVAVYAIDDPPGTASGGRITHMGDYR